MNADLEATLNELGPDYRRLAERVIDAYAAPACERPSAGRTHRLVWGGAALAAAALAVVLSATPVLRRGAEAPEDAPAAYLLAYGGDRASVDAIVRTQRADGSWGNDFLTRQNAAALRTRSDGAGAVAYKRAVRYLRARGLVPLSDRELADRVGRAAQRRQA